MAGRDVQNPTAYYAKIDAVIKARAFNKRVRLFDEKYPGLRERIFVAARLMPDWMIPAFNQWGGLTDKQVAVALKILDTSVDKAWDMAIAEQERRATTPEWTAGRQIVTGKIVSARMVEFETRTRSIPQLKGLIVTAEQRKMWVTIPAAVDGTVESVRGKTITINVTVQPKDSDRTFAFGKRPVLISQEQAAA